MRYLRIIFGLSVVLVYLLGINYTAGALNLGYPAIRETKTAEQREALKLYWSAEKSFGEGHFEEAYAKCQKIRDSYPDLSYAATAGYAMGIISKKMNKNEQAVECFKLVIKRYPLTLDAIYSISLLNLVYKKQGIPFDMSAEFQKLMNVCNTVIKKAKNGETLASAWFIKGELLRGKDKTLGEMKEAYERAKMASPTSEFAAYADYALIEYIEGPGGQGIKKLNMKEVSKEQWWKVIRKGLGSLVTRYPNTGVAAMAQYKIGRSFQVEKKFTPAIEAFKKVLENYPDSYYAPKALLCLGITQWSERQNKGRQYLNELMSKYPDTYESLQAEKWLANNE